MATFASDTYNGTDWQTINAAGADVGGPIVDHPDENPNWYIYQNRALCRTPGVAYYSGTPASANYSVTATITVKSSIGQTGVVGRCSTTERTYYTAAIESSTNKLILAKRVAGDYTQLAISSGAYGIGTHELTLDMNGTTIRALIGGVEILSVTDSAITDAGKAGIRASAVSDTTTGKHLDNFVAEDGGASTPRSSIVGLVGL